MTARTRLGLVLGCCIGAGVAVQGRVNGALGARLADGIAAAVLSFGSGLVVLLVALTLSGRLRRGVAQVRRAVESGVLRPWQLLGGLCGAFFVACQGLTVAMIGVTAFTVAAVAGQLVSSLVVDRLGLAPSGRTPITALRVGGAGLAVLAVIVAGANGSGAPSGVVSLPEALRGGPSALLIILPALAGITLAWQQAVNGQVSAVGGPLSATVVNFAVGFAALIVIEAAVLAGSGLAGGFPTEPWLYLGGLIGVTFIALAALAVRWIGVLLLGLTSVAGQLITALLLDIATPSGAGLSAAAISGCAMTLAAVVTAAWRRS